MSARRECGIEGVVSGLEPGGGEEQRPVRMSAGKQQLYAPSVAQHHGTNLQESLAHRTDIRLGQFGPGECDPANGVEQHLGAGREQHLVLVGPSVVATGAVGEQVKLLSMPK